MRSCLGIVLLAALVAGVVASGGVAGLSSAQAPPQTASDWSVAIAADAAASAGRLAGSASAIVVHDPVFGEEQDCGEHRPWLADELSGCLWHLNWRRSFDGELGARPVGGDINIGDAWKITKGGNVAVAVVDDTWNPSHHDIADNVDLARSHNYAPHPLGESTAAHATSAAGVIAARDNELGGRGIAPRATLYNYNLIEDSKPSNSADAMKRNAASVAVSNNSYGQISLLPKFLWVNDSWWKAVDYGLAHGFGGKGTSYVFSAGNDKSKTPGAGDVNLSEFLTHPGVIGACAVNNGGRATSYSHEGAALWVCAPSNDKNTETQRSVGNGILAPWGGDQYRSFGRTSAATAEVSGVVALVRSANPHLSWRDVKLVLAATAQKNDPSDAGWSTGALQYGSTTNRYSFNRKYGFGVVDASAAVNAALAWKRLPSLVEATARAGVGYDDRHHITANLPEPLADIDDDALTTELTLAGPSSIDFLEHVSATLYISSSHARDLRIELVSPSGTTSTLIDALDSRSKCPNQRTGKHQWNSCFLNLKEITLASNEFLGEDPEGTWKLKITDALSDPSDAGHWNSTSLYGWWLDFAGHAGSSADNAPRARLKVNAVDDISVRASEGTTVRVSATLSGGPLASDVVLPVSVVAGTATAPGSPQADYSVSGPLRIRIRAGRTSGSAAFTIVRDALDEHDETLTVKWQDPGSGQRPNSVLYLGDPIEVTIDGELDPPPPPRTVTLEATPQRVAEGSRVQITARLTGGAWTRAIKLPVSFGPGTASGPFKFPRDHQILTQGSQGVTHITIPAGATSATYSVLVFDDRNHVAPEPDETFSIVAYRPSSLRRHVAVAGSPLVVTIIGDRQRALMPEVSVTAGSSVIEGSAATFTLTASPSPKTPLTVTVKVAQTGDFGVSTGSKTVTIPTSGTAHLNVATVGDSVDEADGSVTAAVTADNSYTVSVSSGRATVAVSDDDDPAPPPERDPPSKACVTADATLLAQVQAKAADPWGGARADLLEMFTRSYRTMQGADTYTTADIKARADKQEPNWQGIGPNPLWQKIYAELDRLETCRAAPPPPPDPEVSVTAGPGVTEGGSASFTVTADPAPAAPLAVSVTVAQTGDYAAAGTMGTKTVTIPTSGSRAFTVATVNDGADEADGSVAVTVNAGSGYTVSSSQASASVAVSDDDDPPPVVPVVSVTAGAGVTEGGSAVFTVTASPAPAAALAVSVTVGQSGDFGVSTGVKTVTIPTSGSKTYTVATVNDNADEADGSVAVTVNAGSGYTVSSSQASASVAVSDDDVPAQTPPVKVCKTTDAALLTRVAAKAADPWNGARPDLVDTFTRSYDTMLGKDTYTVADLKARPDRQEANWQGAGPNALWQSIYAELDRLQACRTAPLTPPPPPPPPVPVVGVVAGSGITEGASAGFTITASPAPASPLTVAVVVAQSGDWGVSTGTKTVTIPTSGSMSYSVATVGDSVDEADGSVTVTLNSGQGYTVSASNGAATVAIADDDVPPPPPPPDPAPEVSITAGRGVTEGGSAVFTVTADPAPASALTVSVRVAQSGEWGVSTGTRTVVVPAGGSMSYSVATAGDGVDEADGSVSVTVSTGSGYTVSGTQGTAVVRVVDDDATLVVLAAAAGSSIAEDGGSREMTVTLGRVLAAGESVTVPLAVSGATAGDHYGLALKQGQGLNGQVTLLTAGPHSAQDPAVAFSAGARQATLVLTAAPNGDTDERTVRVAFAAGQRAPTSRGLSGGVAASGGPVDTSIADDDQPPPPLVGASLSVRDVEVSESGRYVRFMVYLSETPDRDVTVRVATRDRTARDGADYRGVPAGSRTLRFAAGGRLLYRYIYIPILDDNTAEGDETFEAFLTDNNGAPINRRTATITITDND